MLVFVQILIWLHIMGFAFGMAGGMAMGQIGPRLIRSAPDQRDTWWPLAKGFSNVAGVGIVLLLLTGPALLYLRYDWGQGLGPWFMLKMALVAGVVACYAMGKIGMGRLRRGDERGGKLMAVAGPVTGLMAVAAALAAVFVFT